jgi:nucleotide-binding universal stress UspA family protein
VGRPGDVLAELGGKARLLVVGRRSYGGLERMFVGSTSLTAAMHADCPVIVISAASTPEETGDRGVVAVAVSTRPVHASALEWGVREAALRGARLRVVHVVAETVGVEGAAFVAAATAGLDENLEPLRRRHPETSIEVDVLLGNPVDALVEESRAVDLLILGVHRHAVLGGSIRGVIAHAHCPVGLIR